MDYTSKQVGEITGLSRSRVLQYARANSLQAFGNQYIFHDDDIENIRSISRRGAGRRKGHRGRRDDVPICGSCPHYVESYKMRLCGLNGSERIPNRTISSPFWCPLRKPKDDSPLD